MLKRPSEAIIAQEEDLSMFAKVNSDEDKMKMKKGEKIKCENEKKSNNKFELILTVKSNDNEGVNRI